MSRVAILLWIVILLVSLARLQIKTLRKKYIMVIGFLCLAVVLLSTPFGSRLLATRLTEESVVQRQALIGSSLELFRQHPVFGVGLGNFLTSLSLVQKPIAFSFFLQPVHNIFLLILSEIGIVGFGIFLWFLIKTYRHLFAHKQTHGVFLLLLTSLLILGLFDHYLLTLQQGQLLFAIILGLCWGRFSRD